MKLTLTGPWHILTVINLNKISDGQLKIELCNGSDDRMLDFRAIICKDKHFITDILAFKKKKICFIEILPALNEGLCAETQMKATMSLLLLSVGRHLGMHEFHSRPISYCLFSQPRKPWSIPLDPHGSNSTEATMIPQLKNNLKHPSNFCLSLICVFHLHHHFICKHNSAGSGVINIMRLKW